MCPKSAFLAARCLDGRWAATTRPADRGQAGRIGLPGGKVEAGEHPAAAALREAAEEGWRILRHVPDPQGRLDHPGRWVPIAPSDLIPIHEQLVEGRPVVWYAPPPGCYAVRDLSGRHKEAGRVEPVRATSRQIRASGWGNDAALAAWHRLIGGRHG